MAHLHSKDMTHGDLSLKNMLVFREQVKVADFGSAFWAKDFLLPERVAPLTTGYARSPEAWLLDLYGRPNDAWGCGVCALALCTGALPFIGDRDARDPPLPQMIRLLGLPPAAFIEEAGSKWERAWEKTEVASGGFAARACNLRSPTPLPPEDALLGLVEGLLRWQATSLPIPISI